MSTQETVTISLSTFKDLYHKSGGKELQLTALQKKLEEKEEEIRRLSETKNIITVYRNDSIDDVFVIYDEEGVKNIVDEHTTKEIEYLEKVIDNQEEIITGAEEEIKTLEIKIEARPSWDLYNTLQKKHLDLIREVNTIKSKWYYKLFNKGK